MIVSLVSRRVQWGHPPLVHALVRGEEGEARTRFTDNMNKSRKLGENNGPYGTVRKVWRERER